MGFKNSLESHAHSRQILDLLYTYDTFLDSLKVIADFGCGAGMDVHWWATLMTRDDPPEPRNYLVYGVDKDLSRVDDSVKSLENVKLIEGDFEQDHVIPRSCDLIWCHDAFQYSTTPLQTLANWNQQLNQDGMLVLSIKQPVYYQYNRLQHTSHDGVFYNHNIASIMYMLAVSGFDCRDAYFLKEPNSPWLYTATYKTCEPLDPKTATWASLAELGLVGESAINSYNKHSFVKEEDLLTLWLDKAFHWPSE